MGNFNRDNNSGGNRGFGGGRSFGGNRGERREMFSAVCSNCGKDCELPFRPTGERPVFCRDCFAKNGGPEANRRDDRGGNRSDFKRFDGPPRNSGPDNSQMDAINAKLDKILNLLNPAMPGKPKQIDKKIGTLPSEIIEEAMVETVSAPKKANAKKKTVKKSSKSTEPTPDTTESL